MLIAGEQLQLNLKAKLFRGFADPSRLAILEALRSTPLNVGEIVEATGLSQSNISNHLGCLRDCGLVVSEQRGRFTYYRLADDRIDSLLRLPQAPHMADPIVTTSETRTLAAPLPLDCGRSLEPMSTADLRCVSRLLRPGRVGSGIAATGQARHPARRRNRLRAVPRPRRSPTRG